MRRLVLFFYGFLLIASMGCGGEKETETAATETAPGPAANLPPADVVASGGEAITNAAPEVPVEGLQLLPYFDEAGSETELAVAPGVQFTVWVFAKTAAPHATTAAQYSVAFPAGIRVIATTESPKKTVSLGNHERNYMIAYPCEQPGLFWLTSYVCVAEPDFRGGDVSVMPGSFGDTAAPPFIGFTNCEFVDLRGMGGTATLKVK